MEEQEIVGIDLGTEYALISYYRDGMDEPETISMIAGSEIYAVPVRLYRSANEKRWLFGMQAAEAEKKGPGISYTKLLEKAYSKAKIQLVNETYESYEMLGIFLKKLLGMAVKNGINIEKAKVVLAVEELNFEKAEILNLAMEKAGIKRKQLSMIDYLDCFYAFTFHQTQDRYLHDVVLFQYEKGKLKQFYLSRNLQTKPQLVSIEQKSFAQLSKAESNTQKDLVFQQIVEQEFAKKIISTVYLVGDGFEGDWMEQSLVSICRQRKAFAGKNLYTKGACYTLFPENKDYVYIGNNSMKINLSMQLKVQGKEEMVSLINAGDNCYESFCACDVLLDDEPYVDIFCKKPEESEGQINSLELNGLPKRPKKATKVHMTLTPVSDHEVSIEVEDKGLGELFLSSGKKWKFIISA